MKYDCKIGKPKLLAAAAPMFKQHDVLGLGLTNYFSLKKFEDSLQK